MWKGKMAECLKDATLETWGVEVDDRLEMQDGDIFFYKKWPSAFNGTPFQTYLQTMGIDTLIVTGCTTSGCVRGTIYDSFSAGFRTIVPYECVGDMARAAHEQNLADVHKRYADVLPLEEVLSYIRGL
jgi:maleamate amidohydrolase